MKSSVLTLLFSSFFFTGYSQTAEQSKAIDNYIKKVIQINEIPGIAVGIVTHNKVTFQKYYGTETLESDKKVDSNSMFRVYSTTKLMSNIGLFKLVEQGKVSLEDKISKYIDNVPTDWQNVQVKNLVSHSSGLPDWIRFSDISIDAPNAEVIERLSKEKMEFETGSDYRYNQTNYMLITMIIEKITGEKFEDYITENQFSDSQNQVVFSSDSMEKIPNRIVKYIYNNDTHHYDKSTFVEGRRAHSANGLAITLPAFLEWSIHLSKNDFLKPSTQDLMWKPFEYKNKDIKFTHGWDMSTFNNIKSYHFSGGNVSAYRIYPDQNMSIVLMSSGYKTFPVFYTMVNQIAGIMDKQLLNPYTLAEEYTRTESFVYPGRKKEIYGYRKEKDIVIFSYQFPEKQSTELIKNISVAGSFNDWNPDDKVFQMSLKKNNTFELSIPTSKFEKGKTYQFKFIMNKNGWLSVPSNAINVDGSQDNNLTLKID
ncbi:serine hydrolase [Chryseobacterium culicis]|uniref:Serine hydrolase n=1 Tax=Chryseobacterium culicis TaxID=680127 RepID=A0A2S9D1M2_CHRCI|nr:serine hydrolase [Chryseobacterium culicis]PRB86662.1 serine hydrolase [Chryseobacterium culicis]PRB92415.1 serine hydrolase [Chryseobacterium culicis]